MMGCMLRGLSPEHLLFTCQHPLKVKKSHGNDDRLKTDTPTRCVSCTTAKATSLRWANRAARPDTTQCAPPLFPAQCCQRFSCVSLSPSAPAVVPWWKLHRILDSDTRTHHVSIYHTISHNAQPMNGHECCNWRHCQCQSTDYHSKNASGCTPLRLALRNYLTLCAAFIRASIRRADSGTGKDTEKENVGENPSEAWFGW